MDKSQAESVTLEDIVITEELWQRSPHSPNLQAENQAMQTLARQMANQPEMMLETLAEITLNLCQAGSAGVSLLEVTPNGKEVFHSKTLAGRFKTHFENITFCNFSPDGVCLNRFSTQLYEYPERYFTSLQTANTPIIEELMLPLIADNHPLGAIWIMSHDEQRHFDSEDVRVLRLATEAANIYGWEIDLICETFTWSQNAGRLLDFPMPPKLDVAWAAVHPEDVAQMQKSFAQAVENVGEFKAEYRVISPITGKEFWLFSS
jgi:PAS fold